jgi:hypothetical protein
MASGAVLNTPTFLPFTDQSTDVNSYHAASSTDQQFPQVTRGDASDSTDYSALTQEERSKQRFADKWHAAYDASSPSTTKTEEKLPHAAIRTEDREEPLSMSWWPIPDDLMIVAEQRFKSDYSETKTPGRPKTQRQPSIFKKLETRLLGYMHPHYTKVSTPKTASPGGDTTTDTRTPSDTLYHVLLTTSHLEKDINAQIQGLRICGTFTSLPAAKIAAHTCLFSLGYEAEWFTNFQTQHDLQLIDHDELRIVEATGPGGEVFAVDVASVPNSAGLLANSVSGHISIPLYHVVLTVVHYGQDSSGESRGTSVKGSFTEEARAREVAHELLLWIEEGIDKSTYVQYEEAGVGEADCGYGENVVVHAVGSEGENYLVSVLKGEEVESDRVREAAERMRE